MMISRPGSEKHFRQTLGARGASILLETLKTSAEYARCLVLDEGLLHPLTEAVIFSDRAASTFSNLGESEGFRHCVVNGLNLWIVEETYALRIKKLNKSYHSSNQPSEQQERFRDQLPLFEGAVSYVNITTGPVYLDQTSEYPRKFVVVKWCGNKLEWVVDLAELAAGTINPVTLTLPFSQSKVPVLPAKVSVKLKQVTQDSDPALGEQKG